MSEDFQKVKDYIIQLGYSIVDEDQAEEIIIIDDEENGIKNLIIDCENPILILEQLIMETPLNTDMFFKRLLQINRTLVHGAFALDEKGQNILFRDTLQLANLDLNEIEGSISALSLALAENIEELLDYSKG